MKFRLTNKSGRGHEDDQRNCRVFAAVLVAFAFSLLASQPAYAGASSKVTTKPKEGPSELGSELVAWLSREIIVSALHPDGAKALKDPKIALVGARRWRYGADRAVALVCYLSSPVPSYQTEPECSDDSEAAPRVILGVFENGAPPKLLARSSVPLDLTSDWSAPFAEDVPTQGTRVEDRTVVRFDLAPYKLERGEYLFGLRTGHYETYAGSGFGSFISLRLFQIAKGQVVQVFQAPISAEIETAGEWDEDGHRGRGFSGFDLTVSMNVPNKSRPGLTLLRDKRVVASYDWNAKTGRFESASRDKKVPKVK